MNWREPVETEFDLLFLGGEEGDSLFVLENDKCFVYMDGEWVHLIGR